MRQHVTSGETSWTTRARQALKAGALTVATALTLAAGWTPHAQAFVRSQPADTAPATEVVGLSQLPKQAQDVHQRILAGGPFRFEKDGTVFGNRERQLPREPRGFYREYTVPTPGARNRGARRIVCGGKVVQMPETCFYTADHYQSFSRIDPSR